MFRKRLTLGGQRGSPDRAPDRSWRSSIDHPAYANVQQRSPLAKARPTPPLASAASIYGAHRA